MITWNSTRVFGLAGILALGTSFAALAQDTDTTEAPADATEAPAENDAPKIEDELSLGQDPSSDGLGQPYTAETIGDWELRCIKTQDGNDPCQMYQLLSDENNAPISEFSLFRLPEGGRAEAGATVVVPLETSLQEQLTIVVDGNTTRRYPFAYCTQLGCFARIGLTGEDVNIFKRGNAADVSITPVLAPDQKVTVKLSLKGFTAAYDKVSVIQQ